MMYAYVLTVPIDGPIAVFSRKRRAIDIARMMIARKILENDPSLDPDQLISVNDGIRGMGRVAKIDVLIDSDRHEWASDLWAFVKKMDIE